MSAKTLADIKHGDYVAYYATNISLPVKRKVTSTIGGIMLEAAGRNPEFDTKTGRKKPYTPGNTARIAVVTPAIEAYWRQQDNLAEMRKRLERASPACVEAMLKEYPMQHEHLAQINLEERMRLQEWMKSPNGSLRFGRVCFEAVVGGGILVRTDPYDYAVETAARAGRRVKH